LRFPASRGAPQAVTRWPALLALAFLLVPMRGGAVLRSGTTQQAVPAGATHANSKEMLVQDPRISVELARYEVSCTNLASGKPGPGTAESGEHCFELAITNNAGESITAWAVTLERDSANQRAPARRNVRSEDSILIPRQQEIRPRDTRRVQLGNPDRVEFKAAIFTDGTSAGDPEFVRRMVENRGLVYDRTVVAIQRLRAANAAGTPVSQLTREFRELARQESTPAAPPGEIVLPTLVVFGSVSFNLERIAAAKDDAEREQTAIRALLSQYLDNANRIAASKPPIADHPLRGGEPR